MNITTKLITAEETFPLRFQMRPLRAIADQGNAEDKLSTTFHIGAFLNSDLVGIASFNLEAHPKFPSQTPYRLRGMASDKNFRGQNVGRITLDFGLQELRKRECDFLWCNARESAFGFYEKMGLSIYGEMFDIPTIGPHKVMYKHL